MTPEAERTFKALCSYPLRRGCETCCHDGESFDLNTRCGSCLDTYNGDPASLPGWKWNGEVWDEE